MACVHTLSVAKYSSPTRARSTSLPPADTTRISPSFSSPARAASSKPSDILGRSSGPLEPVLVDVDPQLVVSRHARHLAHVQRHGAQRRVHVAMVQRVLHGS